MSAYTSATQDYQPNIFEEQYIFGSAFVDPKLFSHRLGKKTVQVWKYLQRLQAKGSESKKIHYVWCSINGTAKKLGMTHSEVAWAFTKLKKFNLLTPAPADLENELYIGWREHGDHDVYYRRVFGKEIKRFSHEQNCNRSVFQVPKAAEEKLREKSNRGGKRAGAGPQATMLGRIEALKNLPQFIDRENLLRYFLKRYPGQDSEEMRAAIFSERSSMPESSKALQNTSRDINSANFGNKTYNTNCEINPSQQRTGGESSTYERTELEANKRAITSLSTNSSREEMFVAVANLAAALASISKQNVDRKANEQVAYRPAHQVASQPSIAVVEASPQAQIFCEATLDESVSVTVAEVLDQTLDQDQVLDQNVVEDEDEVEDAYRPSQVASQPSQVVEASPQVKSASRQKASASLLRSDSESVCEREALNAESVDKERSTAFQKVSRAEKTLPESREGFRAPRPEILRDGRLNIEALAPVPADWPALPKPESIPETWASSSDDVDGTKALSPPSSLEVYLQPPPKLPGERDSALDAEIVMRAYRAVATRHMGKQCFTLVKPEAFRKSKYYRMALALAGALRQYDLSPMVWFEWSFGKWRGDSPPPLNFLLSDTRVEKYADWCEREMGSLMMPRRIVVPSFEALSRRCWLLQQTLASVTKAQRRSVVEFFFPDYLFEEMRSQVKKDSEKILETIKSYVAGGRDWIWS